MIELLSNFWFWAFIVMLHICYLFYALWRHELGKRRVAEKVPEETAARVYNLVAQHLAKRLINPPPAPRHETDDEPTTGQ
jgi:cbb3-type cytochrome oxidase subunit 3